MGKILEGNLFERANGDGQSVKVAVVMPALNEEKSVGGTINRVKAAFAGSSLPVKVETVVVDGNSKDDTVAVAKSEGSRVIIQKDKGYGDALYSGFVYSFHDLESDIICTLDADGSYEESTLVKGVAKLINDDYDFVVGARIPEADAMKMTHRFGNELVSALVRSIIGVNVTDSQSGMYMFRADLVENMSPKVRGWAFNTELLTCALESEYRIGEVKGVYRNRIGAAKHSIISGAVANFAALLRMTRDSRPLLFHGVMSVALLFVSLLLGVRTFLISSQLLAILTALVAIAGIQILIFGLVADMIKDVRVGQMKKPTPYKVV